MRFVIILIKFLCMYVCYSMYDLQLHTSPFMPLHIWHLTLRTIYSPEIISVKPLASENNQWLTSLPVYTGVCVWRHKSRVVRDLAWLLSSHAAGNDWIRACVIIQSRTEDGRCSIVRRAERWVEQRGEGGRRYCCSFKPIIVGVWVNEADWDCVTGLRPAHRPRDHQSAPAAGNSGTLPR